MVEAKGWKVNEDMTSHDYIECDCCRRKVKKGDFVVELEVQEIESFHCFSCAWEHIDVVEIEPYTEEGFEPCNCGEDFFIKRVTKKELTLQCINCGESRIEKTG